MFQENRNISEFYNDIKALWDCLGDVNPISWCKCDNCACELRSQMHKMLLDHTHVLRK